MKKIMAARNKFESAQQRKLRLAIAEMDSVPDEPIAPTQPDGMQTGSGSDTSTSDADTSAPSESPVTEDLFGQKHSDAAKQFRDACLGFAKSSSDRLGLRATAKDVTGSSVSGSNPVTGISVWFVSKAIEFVAQCSDEATPRYTVQVISRDGKRVREPRTAYTGYKPAIVAVQNIANKIKAKESRKPKRRGSRTDELKLGTGRNMVWGEPSKPQGGASSRGQARRQEKQDPKVLAAVEASFARVNAAAKEAGLKDGTESKVDPFTELSGGWTASWIGWAFSKLGYGDREAGFTEYKNQVSKRSLVWVANDGEYRLIAKVEAPAEDTRPTGDGHEPGAVNVKLTIVLQEPVINGNNYRRYPYDDQSSRTWGNVRPGGDDYEGESMPERRSFRTFDEALAKFKELATQFVKGNVPMRTGYNAKTESAGQKIGRTKRRLDALLYPNRADK